MVMEDCTESCSSRVVENYAPVNRGNKRQREKADVYLEVLHRLKELNVEEAKDSSFQDDLWAHFNRLTLRYALYALDMNIEKAEDVLMHKRLLQMAQNPATRPAIEVRVVQGTSTGNSGDFIHSTTSRRIDAPSSGSNSRDKSSFMIEKKKHKGLVENANIFSPVSPLSVLPSLAHPLLSHVEVALQGTNLHFQDSDGSTGSDTSNSGPRHEITISTNDMPKFLSQLTSLMSGMGLNIHEAHAFSTVDGYSLDVFVVDGWKDGGSEELKASLIKEIQMIEKSLSPKHHIIYDADKQEQNGFKRGAKLLNGHDGGSDSWEIDASLLRFEKKIASGSYGDLYKGTYYSQDVAIKVFSTEHLNKSAQQEFAQEVYIMRKIRHKNVVQFIGACTRPPSLCIVTEYMPGGSVFEFLHKQQDVLKLSTLLKWAIDVSNGMNYLHQHKIIHRDLKTANLLMDENNVVKIADFGVAKVQTQPGVMTAETGTYRWMAPEVIEHKPYDHKADVFSFGIVLWELLTGKLPYEELTPLQAAIGVVHKGLRPKIPSHTHPVLEKLLTRCWQRDPSLRPDFSEIVEILKHISNTT